MSYDLILKTYNIISENDFSSIQQSLRQSDIPRLCEVMYFSFNDALDKYDVEDLQDAIEDGEITSDQFQTFCRENGFSSISSSPSHEAVAAFFEQQYGRDIACVMLTRTVELAYQAYPTIVSFAQQKALQVGDLQLGENIDLSAPGQLPPSY